MGCVILTEVYAELAPYLGDLLGLLKQLETLILQLGSGRSGLSTGRDGYRELRDQAREHVGLALCPRCLGLTISSSRPLLRRFGRTRSRVARRSVHDIPRDFLC
jgi:hypothetical protein